MLTYWRSSLVALALLQTGASFSQEEPQTEPSKPVKPTRADLRDKQLDVSLEARDIERILGKLKKASDLSKQRISEAAKVAEAASTSIDKGDSKTARTEAQQTAEMFREIAKQLEALLKEDAPQQIAEARQIAQQLAKEEREFAETFQGALNPTQVTGKGKVDPKSQVKPMASPDMKSKGNGKNPAEGQNGAGGKKPNDETAKDGQDKGDKPMPDGVNGKGNDQEKDNGSGKKNDMPAGSGNSDDKQNGNKDKEKKSDGGGGKDDPSEKSGAGAGPKKDEGQDPDEKQSGGGGSSKNKDMPMTDTDQDGSGDDKSNDKKRSGSGAGPDDDPMQDKTGSGSGRGQPLTAEQLRELAAGRAEQLAERGKTLQDVLNAIAQSTDPNDKEAVAKIQAILKEIDLNKLVTEMTEVSNMIRSKQDNDARLSSFDAAERLEIMAQRLDGAYRVIVAPQAEELRKLEATLADLREQLDKLETPGQVLAWHREARELLDELDKLGVNLKAREELELAMTKAGFGVTDKIRRDVGWGVIDGRYDAPAGYRGALLHLQEDVQQRIQTLILGDLGNVSDDATPPKYQDLVERYYEVLSKSSKPEASTKGTAPKPKTDVKTKTK